MDSVVLLPTDVPGAMLQENVRLEDHSVKELKRWLECRSLKQTGSKDELIKRINDCIDNGGTNKMFLGIDQGKWYDMRRNILQNPTSHKGTFDVFQENLMWSRFPSRPLPQYFNKRHIFTYIVNENIESENPEVVERDKDSIVTVKPFRRGSQYVDSDHLSQIYDSLIKCYYYCKCKCQASFDKKIKHDVIICLNNISGAVVRGKCDCKQSAMGKCSHITALLLFLSKYIEEHGHVPVASTSSHVNGDKAPIKGIQDLCLLIFIP